MWNLKKRERYALIEQDSENPRKHRGTFYIGPRHVKHHSTKEFVEFSYVTAPNFASEKDCRVFAQNSHVAIEIYDFYVKLFDPDYETVSVYDERFDVQYLFKEPDTWRSVDYYNPTIQVIPLEDGVEIKRIFDTDYGTQTLEISHVVRTGAFLKHTIKFTNKTVDTKTFRVVMKLAGITSNKVNGETVTAEKHVISPVFFIGEDNQHLKLSEYLWKQGVTDEETGEWTATTLKDIIFDVHAEGCKADIIIGNYTLAESESLLIDPDSTTFYAGTGTGHVSANDANWNTAHDATTGTVSVWEPQSTTAKLGAQYYIRRLFVAFDTSGLGDVTLLTATLRAYCRSVLSQNHGTRNHALVKTTKATPNGLIGGDFDQCGAIDNPTEGATRLVITATGWKEWALTDLSWVIKDGWTELGIRTGWLDCDDVAPTVGAQEAYIKFDGYMEDNPPELVVTWEEGAPSTGWHKLQYFTEPPTAGAFNKLRFASEPPVSGAWNKLLYEGE